MGAERLRIFSRANAKTADDRSLASLGMTSPQSVDQRLTAIAEGFFPLDM